MLLILGIVAGVLGLFANVPYIIDTIKGKTSPHRISWSIFLLVNIITLANQMASGATTSLLLVIGFSLSQLVIVILSFKKGVGGLGKLDIVCLLGAFVGIGLWMYFQTPIVSIVSNIVVCSIALLPTLIKAYKRPETETKLTWLLGGIGALLGAFSVGAWNIDLLLFPVYSAVVQLLMYVILECRRAILGRQPKTEPVSSASIV